MKANYVPNHPEFCYSEALNNEKEYRKEFINITVKEVKIEFNKRDK